MQKRNFNLDRPNDICLRARNGSVAKATGEPKSRDTMYIIAALAVTPLLVFGVCKGVISASDFLRHLSGNDESRFSMNTVENALNRPCLREINEGDAFKVTDSKKAYKILVTKASPLSSTAHTNIVVQVSSSPLNNAHKEDFWPPQIAVVWPKKPSSEKCDLKSFNIPLDGPKS